MAIWNYIEIRSCNVAALEHAPWKAVDEKGKFQIREIESWPDQISKALRAEREERARQERLYEACLCKDDFFALHPGQFESFFYDGHPTDPRRMNWFYLPPGKHKLSVSIVRATRQDRQAELDHTNCCDPSDQHTTEILDKRDMLLTGEQIREIVFHREPTEAGCTYSCALDGEVLVETDLFPAKKSYSLRQVRGFPWTDPNISTPYAIAKVKESGGHYPNGPNGARENAEFEFKLRKPLYGGTENRLPLPDFKLTFEDESGTHVQLYFRFHLEIEGGPRANIVEYGLAQSFLSLLDNTRFEFDDWFELRDGLYFLRAPAKSSPAD